MSKYENLCFHLASLDKSTWHASFEQIENILRFPLPKSAYTYPAWWANQTGEGHTQSSAWQNAGWKTSDLDLQNQKVTFHYVGNDNRSTLTQPATKKLTISDAKEGLAANFGVPVEAIEIVIKG